MHTSGTLTEILLLVLIVKTIHQIKMEIIVLKLQMEMVVLLILPTSIIRMSVAL